MSRKFPRPFQRRHLSPQIAYRLSETKGGREQLFHSSVAVHEKQGTPMDSWSAVALKERDKICRVQAWPAEAGLPTAEVPQHKVDRLQAACWIWDRCQKC